MPSYTAQSPVLRRVQYDINQGTPLQVHAFFETELVNDDDPNDVVVRPWKEAKFVIPEELALQIFSLASAAIEDE